VCFVQGFDSVKINYRLLAGRALHRFLTVSLALLQLGHSKPKKGSIRTTHKGEGIEWAFGSIRTTQRGGGG